MNPQAVTIRESHAFKGSFPQVPTNHPHVDTTLLYENDSAPFHLTLPIAEVGRRSANGILYTEDLVQRIAEQLPGLGGNRGHIPEGLEDSAFPLEEVFWIGQLRENGLLWAKGYVPPGRTREFIRHKMAIGGEIATSIFGKAIKEMDTQKRGFVLRELELESVDLAPAKRASLKNQRGFAITREFEQEGEVPMPDKAQLIAELTAADIPTTLREQIVREAQVQLDAARVHELEDQKQKLEHEVKEMREYASIVTTIRSLLPANVDIAAAVSEMQNSFAAIRNVLGDNVNIVTTVEEMHRTIGEMRRTEFTRVLDDKVAEMTPWPVTQEEDKRRVAQFRATFKNRLSAEIGGDKQRISETAQKLWGDEFQLLAETLVQSLAGPSAFVGGKPQPHSPIDTLKSEAGLAAVLEKFGRH